MKIMDHLHSWNGEGDYDVRKVDGDHCKSHDSKAKFTHQVGKDNKDFWTNVWDTAER